METVETDTASIYLIVIFHDSSTLTTNEPHRDRTIIYNQKTKSLIRKIDENVYFVTPSSFDIDSMGLIPRDEDEEQDFNFDRIVDDDPKKKFKRRKYVPLLEGVEEAKERVEDGDDSIVERYMCRGRCRPNGIRLYDESIRPKFTNWGCEKLERTGEVVITDMYTYTQMKSVGLKHSYVKLDFQVAFLDGWCEKMSQFDDVLRHKDGGENLEIKFACDGGDMYNPTISCDLIETLIRKDRVKDFVIKDKEDDENKNQ